MGYKCIGCDVDIFWDGIAPFSFTCSCGSTIFYHDVLKSIAIPSSVLIAIHKKQSIPHLDSLVGTSPYTSPVKEAMIKELMEHGAIWMKDCEQCKKDGTYQRELDREKEHILFEAEMIIKNHQGGN